MAQPNITPLRKKTLGGEVYTRNEKVEANILELQALPAQQLVARCTVQERDNPVYVPSECILYFLREYRGRGGNVDCRFEQLYKILAERVLRRLPTGENAEGETLSKSLVRENVFERFVELLASDLQCYSEKLDFYEVRFDAALTALRQNTQKEVWRHENRSKPLLTNEETGELLPEMERAAGTFDPFNTQEIGSTDYRLRLAELIESLPVLQRAIVEMLQKDIPIDSKEPDAVTIAKTLGKSEKTIRLQRDKALASLRAALERPD